MAEHHHIHHHHTSFDTLFRYAERLRYGELHIKWDEETGLKALIAIHSLKRGAALGGCRWMAYETEDKAAEDVLRLGFMMSMKAAIINLPHGGAKAVIIKPKQINNYDAYFEKMGEFINELNGRYITAVDSGTGVKEMDIIARRTPYVTCTSGIHGGNGDPSVYTAFGVRRGIEAAVKFKLAKDSLQGVHIAIQGAGHVGYLLAQELTAQGALLTMADVNAVALQRCVDAFAVRTCAPEKIYDIEADVFAPCAMGAILNLETIQRLNVPIVAGSANNQLAHHQFDNVLYERGILYAPDFVINAGGLIHVAVLYDHGDLQKSHEQINRIYDTLLEIFQQAAKDKQGPGQVAERMALERLK